MINKNIKRILGLFLTLILTMSVFLATTQKTYAATDGFEVIIDGTKRTFTGKRLTFNYADPALYVFGDNQGYNATQGANLTIKSPTFMYFVDNLNNTVYEELLDENSDPLIWIIESYGATLGAYGLTLETSGDIVRVVLEIQDVPDNKRPAISGEENFATNVDDAKPIEFFQAYLSAWDETDGDVTDRIFIKKDNYTPNKSVLGRHEVIFAVDDLSGNEAELVVYINVYDLTKPVITGNAAVVRIGYKETWNIETFRKTLVAKDNYDTLTNADIKVKSDNYTSNKGRLGTYDVIFNVKDSSNNEGTFTKPIQVYDNVIPTFSGPQTISTSNNTLLSERDVRNQLTANDEIDGNITSKIKLVEDNYTGKGNKVGSYTIKYSVEDNAGNIAYHTVTINRIDNIPPIIWIEDGVTIKTTKNTPLTHQQVIDILIATGQVTVTAQTRFTVLEDEYTGNEQQPGIYLMSIQARSMNGNESVHNMAITVLDDDDGGNDIDVKPPFNIGTFILDNIVIFIIILIVIILVVVYRFNNKKKRYRRK